MSSELKIMRFNTRKAWRARLVKHYASSPGIWFTFYKVHSAHNDVAYEDAFARHYMRTAKTPPQWNWEVLTAHKSEQRFAVTSH